MAALSSFGPAPEGPRPVRASLAPVFVQAPRDVQAKPPSVVAKAAEDTAPVKSGPAQPGLGVPETAMRPEQAKAIQVAKQVDLAREAEEARKELAESAVTVMAATSARDAIQAAAPRTDYGFSKLFENIITAKPDELGLSQDILKFGPMRVREDLVGTILRAARETNSDPVLLMAIADKESSFSISVGASTSSAVGLFQFVEGTWLTVVRQFGARYGLAKEAALIEGSDEAGAMTSKDRARILDMRKDPYLSALFAAEMLKRDAADIGAKLGRDLTPEEIYLAHFFGPYDAYKFLDKVDTEPKLVAAKLLPRPARANRPIFYSRNGRKSKSLSVAEVHKKIETAMGLRLDRYRDVTNSLSTATAYAPISVAR
ncbi:MAG: transglycosylase domain protein [Hyphomicrobiales bacterium]|nr:transglycosylase domain protein [Hyphomicrobiales bacterium]